MTGGTTGVTAPSGMTGGPTGVPSFLPPVSYALLYAGCVLTITCLLPVVLFFTAIRYIYCDLCKSGLAMLSMNAWSFYLLFSAFCIYSKQLFSYHSHLVHANLSLSVLLMFILYCISIGAGAGTLSRVRREVPHTAVLYGWIIYC